MRDILVADRKGHLRNPVEEALPAGAHAADAKARPKDTATFHPH
jgi:hypothetical protein